MAENIAVQMSIYMKLQKLIRVLIAQMNLKKTGYNSHLNYYYYDLGDFLPQATKLIADAGLCTVFNIGYDSNGIEMATLTLTDGMEMITFSIPTANVPRQEGIFETGSKNTYCKRYLYMNLLELTEPDVAEITNTGVEKKKENSLISNDQWVMLNKMYSKDEIKKMYEELGITNGKNIPVEYYMKKKKEYEDKFQKEHPEKEFY